MESGITRLAYLVIRFYLRTFQKQLQLVETVDLLVFYLLRSNSKSSSTSLLDCSLAGTPPVLTRLSSTRKLVIFCFPWRNRHLRFPLQILIGLTNANLILVFMLLRGSLSNLTQRNGYPSTSTGMLNQTSFYLQSGAHQLQKVLLTLHVPTLSLPRPLHICSWSIPLITLPKSLKVR